MKKNRYLLCLLACGLMLYFAVPRLSLTFHSVKGVFSFAWLLFALMVVAGNLTGLLYAPKRHVQHVKTKERYEKKSRSYH